MSVGCQRGGRIEEAPVPGLWCSGGLRCGGEALPTCQLLPGCGGPPGPVPALTALCRAGQWGPSWVTGGLRRRPPSSFQSIGTRSCSDKSQASHGGLASRTHKVDRCQTRRSPLINAHCGVPRAAAGQGPRPPHSPRPPSDLSQQTPVGGPGVPAWAQPGLRLDPEELRPARPPGLGCPGRSPAARGGGRAPPGVGGRCCSSPSLPADPGGGRGGAGQASVRSAGGTVASSIHGRWRAGSDRGDGGPGTPTACSCTGE